MLSSSGGLPQQSTLVYQESRRRSCSMLPGGVIAPSISRSAAQTPGHAFRLGRGASRKDLDIMKDTYVYTGHSPIRHQALDGHLLVCHQFGWPREDTDTHTQGLHQIDTKHSTASSAWQTRSLPKTRDGPVARDLVHKLSSFKKPAKVTSFEATRQNSLQKHEHLDCLALICCTSSRSRSS